MTKFLGYALVFYLAAVVAAFLWDEGKRLFRKRHLGRSLPSLAGRL